MQRLDGEFVMIDTECKEKLEMEEHFPVPKRVYITREDLEMFGIHSEMSRVHVVAQGDGQTST